MLLAGTSSLLIAGPKKDVLTVTGQTDSTGFTPTVDPSGEWVYASTIQAGVPLADTIPVQFVLTDTNGVPEILPYNVTLKAVGQLAGSITFDTSSFGISDGQTLTHYIYINTVGLAPGDYVANVQVQATPADAVDAAHTTIHIHVHVVDPPGGPTCFVTDSTGLQLTDCNGNPVSTGGEFLIVSNGKKVAATNPGQLYYNFVWQNNTGAPVTFTSLLLSATNVAPVGANSVHVLIYNSTQFTAGFDDVNTSGIPCGQSGVTCKSPITVPAGDTLWLTWHVTYQWTGSALWPDIPPAASCPTSSLHGTVSMHALLTSSDSTVSITCAAGANGYSK